MLSLRSSNMFSTALSVILSLTALSPVAAVPTPQVSNSPSQTSGYWLGQTQFHSNSPVWGNPDTNYKVYRNVKDYGATGDGSTDDTNAINAALSAGNRCGVGCNSSTITPAIVYFPAGTYQVHAPIIMEYYTQLIGDANNLPILKATANFSGIALLDADPYGMYGVNWYINQNNFFRQVRNFVIDITGISGNTGAGIHWQVAQATSLQNIVFNMKTGADSEQQGIFMDNGSGGFMGDLVFNGGKFGAFFGNQQFTSRNMTFNGCQTAIFMNWNWGWTLSGITVNGPGAGGNSTGIDMANSPQNQTVGSVIISDSTFAGVSYGIRSAYSKSSDVPATGGTLIIDNVDMTLATHAVVDATDNEVLAGGGKIVSWASGNVYDKSGTVVKTQGIVTAPTKPTSLLSNGNVFSRSKPQYEGALASDFIQAMVDGKCMGDGSSDDTQCVQNFLNNAASTNKIAYFNHGVYRVTNTIHVPDTIKIVGELWATILASGFNSSTPTPVWQIGKPGDRGACEISDMLFEIDGPNPAAIMIQWDLTSAQGASGMWDTHIRMGGSVNSQLTLSNCAKQPGDATVNPHCEAGFMMFYASPQSSGVYLENTWFWTADHDMEDPLNQQISVYNGRGMLIRSGGPVWLWGTSSEHSIIFNYQFDGVKALFAGFMQSETPYFQPYPTVPTPFSYNPNYDDPTFTVCQPGSGAGNEPCKDAWGLRIVDSQGVLIYGTGFYSFFNGYTQGCVIGEDCQENMIHIQNSQVSMYAVTTKAAVNMLIDDNGVTVKGADNMDVYADTMAYYNTQS
ncbi:hypothetical protein LTR82_001807 [Friedmanniomyces endolithicus]|uniref:Rhamnogalacturonase A/B/Epimerase-like pectate lyase domain-containing protein n=1 Tax=Friedmanniomyces endolithicus TaxID=329885 RepID=A0AAN6JJX3_9PEZI|nr:hypothetical protein LTR82_001807 [Friedmanniomyces endolithicus]